MDLLLLISIDVSPPPPHYHQFGPGLLSQYGRIFHSDHTAQTGLRTGSTTKRLNIRLNVHTVVVSVLL